MDQPESHFERLEGDFKKQKQILNTQPATDENSPYTKANASNMKIIDESRGEQAKSSDLQLSQTMKELGGNTADLREKFDNENEAKYLDKMNALKDFSGIMGSLSNDSNQNNFLSNEQSTMLGNKYLEYN